MNISQAAQHAGLPAKTIRYYEEIGLVTPQRDSNGYRRFRDSDLQQLRLIAQARSLGFSIAACRALVALSADRARASADVKALASEQLQQIEAKIVELRALHRSLAELVASCAGNAEPDCNILTGLQAGKVAQASAAPT